MEASVAVIGLGRVGLPLALSFADRGLRTIGVEREQEVLDQLAAGRMPFSETGTQERARARGGGRPARAHAGRAGRRAGRPHRAHPAHAVLRPHRDRHLARSRRDRRPAAGAARGPFADPALHRRAGHHRVGGGLHRAAARLPRRRGPVRLARAGADRREPLPRGDRDAAVHHRRGRARARAPRRRSCSRRSAPRSSRPRPCRPSWRRSGPTSCATPSSRSPTS